MKENNWKITTIETTKWANNFAKLLKKGAGKTYFLQGKWGSGKTEYIKKVDELTKKDLKFVYLKLWKPKDNKSLTRQLFSVACPILSGFIIFFSWVVVSAMVAGSAWLALKDLLPTNVQWLLPATIIATVLTTLFNLTTNKVINVDVFLSWLTLKKLQSKCFRPIVLVIDDFDRINPKMQKELYKLFNAIQEKGDRARIIFVGDYENIQKNKDNYLSKIIDQIIALPIVLNAGGVASRLEETISNNLGENLNGSTIKELFIDEDRTLRDANQFLSYVKGEFCFQKKKGRVQTDQQLYIIYLYLFHKKHYKRLYEDWLKPKYRNHRSNSNDKIDQYTENVLSPVKKYPKEYRRNQPAYFINELSTNHSISELIDFVKNQTTALKKITFSEKNDSDNYYPELLQFLEFRSSDGYFKEIKSQLCKAALFAMNSEPRHKPNNLIKAILIKAILINSIYTDVTEFTDNSSKLLTPAKKLDKNFNEIYKNADYEISSTRLIYIYRTCFPIFGTDNLDSHDTVEYSPINRFTLTSIYFEQAEKIVKKENFGQQAYDAEALLVLLCFNPDNIEGLKIYDANLFSSKRLTVKSKVDKIEQLCDTEYMAFWDAYLKHASKEVVEKALNFNYKEQNYANMMYSRCSQIKRRFFYCFESEEGYELANFFKSDKWICFLLRIVDLVDLNEQKYTGDRVYEDYLYDSIRTEVNKLLTAYYNSEEKQLHVLENAHDEKAELEVMQNLLERIESDPYWTSKLVKNNNIKS